VTGRERQSESDRKRDRARLTGRERDKARVIERERQNESGRKRERGERERECACVCVGVCVREIEGKREKNGQVAEEKRREVDGGNARNIEKDKDRPTIREVLLK